jgi:uncharacterized protein (TIGR02001 family)
MTSGEWGGDRTMMRMPNSAAKGFMTLSALLLFLAPATAGGLEGDFDIAFGAAVTSDYVYAGISQSDGGPALQGYVEANYGMFYAGAWASNVDFGDSDVEIDLYAGIRPETDSAAFDLGYIRYVYADGTSPDYGALAASAEYYATDSLTVGGNTNFAPNYAQMDDYALWGEGTVDFALPADFGVSGGLGYQYYAGSLDLPSYWAWNAGVYWSWKETVTIDVRYAGSDLSRSECADLMSRNACGHRLFATLSVDTAASALISK